MNTAFSSIYLFSVFASIALLASCGGSSGGSDSDDPRAISSINVSDAKALIISDNLSPRFGSRVGSNIAANNPGSDNRLFKITDSGFIVEVTVTDDDGNTSTLTENPIYIEKVTSDYLVVGFGLDSFNPFDAYLVNINTDQAFPLPQTALPATGPSGAGFKNSGYFQVDSSENIYYIGQETAMNFGDRYNLHRLKIQGPSQIVVEQITPAGEDVYEFAVDSNGNVAYQARLEIDLNIQVKRIILNTGGFFNLPIDSCGAWVAPDGNLYLEDTGMIKRASISGGVVTLIDYGILNQGVCSYNGFLLNVGNYSIIVEEADVKDVFNPSNTPRIVDIGMLSNETADASNLNYYAEGRDINGDSTIRKIDPTTDMAVDLYSPGIYDVYSFSVTPDDLVTFSALRLSDGVSVIGEINPSGGLSILDEVSSIKATIIEPL